MTTITLTPILTHACIFAVGVIIGWILGIITEKKEAERDTRCKLALIRRLEEGTR